MYETRQHLLDLWNSDRAELMRQVKETLIHFHRTGRPLPGGLRCPIWLSPYDTATSHLLGYEGGEFDPKELGTTCIVVPPTEGSGSHTKGTWTLGFTLTPQPSTPQTLNA